MITQALGIGPSHAPGPACWEYRAKRRRHPGAPVRNATLSAARTPAAADAAVRGTAVRQSAADPARPAAAGAVRARLLLGGQIDVSGNGQRRLQPMRARTQLSTRPKAMAPSQVNDSARAMMAAVAKWRDDIGGTITTAGTSTAYTVTTKSGLRHAGAYGRRHDRVHSAYEPAGRRFSSMSMALGLKPLRSAPRR